VQRGEKAHIVGGLERFADRVSTVAGAHLQALT
jgi:hypothetical protein